MGEIGEIYLPDLTLFATLLKSASHCGSEITATGVVAEGDSGLASSFIAGARPPRSHFCQSGNPSRLGFLTDVRVALGLTHNTRGS